MPTKRHVVTPQAHVALFRGINVGKAKRVAMADLRELLTRLGFGEVRTLLNSGNAVFLSQPQPAADMAASIRRAVSKELGVDALVIVKTLADIDRLIAENALQKEADNHSRLLVAITQHAKDLRALRSSAAESVRHHQTDQLHLGSQGAYLWCPAGILESRLAETWLAQLRDAGTTRNWATLLKIRELMAKVAGDGR